MNKLNPTAFSIGGFPIQWYGVLVTLGFIISIGLAIFKLEKWYKISSNPLYYFVFLGIPTALLGARAWSFIIGDASKTLQTQSFLPAFFDFRNGGLAIEGGIMLTVIAALIFFYLILKKPKYHIKTQIGKQMYIKRISMWVYADAIVPCILIGQVIGRWGNFFNQEVYGPQVSAEGLSWLKTIMPAVYDGMFIDGAFHHPFFLYESFFNFWFFLFLYFIGEFIKKRKAGDLAIGYFILYGLLRTIMEPFRFGPFRYVTSIVFSALFIFFGIFGLLANHLLIAKNRHFKMELFLKLNWQKLWYKICKKPLPHTKTNWHKQPHEMLFYNNF